jgi:hypothetical protein
MEPQMIEQAVHKSENDPRLGATFQDLFLVQDGTKSFHSHGYVQIFTNGRFKTAPIYDV